MHWEIALSADEDAGAYTEEDLEIMAEDWAMIEEAVVQLMAGGIEELSARRIVNANWTGDGDTVEALMKVNPGPLASS